MSGSRNILNCVDSNSSKAKINCKTDILCQTIEEWAHQYQQSAFDLGLSIITLSAIIKG